MRISMRIPRNMADMPMEELAAWAVDAGLDGIDIKDADPAVKTALEERGLRVGSVDAVAIQESLSRDEERREEAVLRLKEQIDKVSSMGLSVVFGAMAPDDVTASRRDTFSVFAETYPEIMAHAESRGVALAMEPFPGPAPYYPNIGCTPELYRAMFAAVPSKSLGICYDPSHYMRFGIDYLRILDEFGDRVRYVHGKDTEIMPEGRYLYGTIGYSLEPTVGWSGGDWRYCIPGTGDVDWAKVLGRLKILGYQGMVSVELEDHIYRQSIEGCKEGISKAARYLRSLL